MSRHLRVSRIIAGASNKSSIAPHLRIGRWPMAVTAVAAALLVTVSVALAQFAAGDGATFKGKVVDDFGGKIVIETDAGKLLVEPRGGAAAAKVTTGETLVVTGNASQRVIDATRIVRENGETVFFASSTAAPAVNPAPSVPPAAGTFGGWAAQDVSSAQIQAVLKDHGLTQVGTAERKKRHIEIPTRSADGRNVIASLDLFGRIWEIEDAEHDNKTVPVQLTSETQAANVITQAGYSTPRAIERRKHHFEVLTTSRSGEPMEIHVNLAGHIYKRVWVR